MEKYLHWCLKRLEEYADEVEAIKFRGIIETKLKEIEEEKQKKLTTKHK